MAFVKKFWHGEEGVVESTLVIIPLIILFLASAALIVSVNYRNLDLAYAQTDATSAAITSAASSADEVVSFSSSSGGFRLLITHRKRTLPNLIPHLPFLGDTRSIDVTGLAVMEGKP
jgi:hypothetical protein